MNPARAFGPELVQGIWDDWWVYWIGPVLGGAAAALAYDWLYLRGDQLPVVGSPVSGVDEPRPGGARFPSGSACHLVDTTA